MTEEGPLGRVALSVEAFRDVSAKDGPLRFARHGMAV